MRFRLLAATLALFGVVAVQATAHGTHGRWTGKTNQGRAAIVKVDEGRITLIKTKYKARCRNKRFTWTSQQIWQDKPDGPIEQADGQFSDSGPWSHPYKRGSVTIEGSIAGTMTDTRIDGKQTLVIRVFNARQRQIDVCKSRISFTVRPEE